MISEVAVGDRVVRVPKILCVARNYADHAKEMGTPVPQEPIFFLKPTTALLPGGGTILLPPESKRVEVETELAVILKAGGRDVSAAKAMDLVGGYAVFFDITARDLQAKAREEGGPWTAAKGFGTFAPISKGFVADRGITPHGLTIWIRVTGCVRAPPGEARPPLARQSGPSLLGELDGTGHSPLRRRCGKGPPEVRHSDVGERRKVAATRGPEGVGVGGRREGGGGSFSLRRGSDGRGRASPPLLGHRVEAQRGYPEGSRSASGVDRSGRDAVEATATGTTPRTHRSGDRLRQSNRVDFERIIAVETESLAPIVGQEEYPRGAFPAAPVANPPL